MSARRFIRSAAASMFMFCGALQQASATPVTGATFGIGDNGGIGLGFAFLNSLGTNPLATSSSWQWCSSCDLVFQAIFGSATYSNYPGNNTIAPFGAP